MNTDLLPYQTQLEDETSVLHTQQQRIHANNFAQQNKWLLLQYWIEPLLKQWTNSNKIVYNETKKQDFQ